MKKVRIGIVGLGAMGSTYADYIQHGDIPRMQLCAVCHRDEAKMSSFDDAIHTFTRVHDMIRSGIIDALLIATPHYTHTSIGIDALEQGLHVLVEKPISVHIADAEKLLAAHTSPTQVFGAIFNQRTLPIYGKVKQLIDEGSLGTLQRIHWTITDWFRSEAYYASSSWRATWAGEGGGVLLNQAPHNLDLLQWFFGMPNRVRGFCSRGKYHAIEVEDEVTAYLEYPHGVTGVFMTSTGEIPGTNRLEIAGDKGRLVMENEQLTLTRNTISTKQYSKTTDALFGIPEVQKEEVIVVPQATLQQHVALLQNFTEAILDHKALIAPAQEGLKSLALANAILLSSLQGTPIDIPMDAEVFKQELQRLIKVSADNLKDSV